MIFHLVFKDERKKELSRFQTIEEMAVLFIKRKNSLCEHLVWWWIFHLQCFHSLSEYLDLSPKASFNFSFLLGCMQTEKSQVGDIPVTEEIQNRFLAPDFQVWPNTNLPVVGIWGMNKWLRDRHPSLYPQFSNNRRILKEKEILSRGKLEGQKDGKIYVHFEMY